ncbi:MAG TPA: hypothetical protein DCS42_08695, partial [Nitrospiraceae bacterium]|nr:hypothetical protein [Nitrospiraceae bacterium]
DAVEQQEHAAEEVHIDHRYTMPKKPSSVNGNLRSRKGQRAKGKYFNSMLYAPCAFYPMPHALCPMRN